MDSLIAIKIWVRIVWNLKGQKCMSMSSKAHFGSIGIGIPITEEANKNIFDENC